MMNFIVGIISAITVGFVVLWSIRPAFREWVERPKYTILKNDQRLLETQQERAI